MRSVRSWRRREVERMFRFASRPLKDVDAAALVPAHTLEASYRRSSAWCARYRAPIVGRALTARTLA